MKAWLGTHKHGTIIFTTISPGAKKSELQGIQGAPERLKIRIKAPPVDGKANKEVIAFVSNCLGLRKNQVEIYRGELSRTKDIYVDMAPEQVLDKLNKILDKKLQEKLE